MNIHQKLLLVQDAVGRVPKTGYNSFQRYHYVTESDLLDAIRSHMVEQGLTLLMLGMEEEIGQYEDGKRWAKVKVNFRIVNAENPQEEFIDTDSVGYAEDNGDKAIYKAITGASKYLYYKLFLVSTGDDPEREEQPVKGKAAPQRAAAPAVVKKPESKPAPPQVRSILALQMKHQLTNEQVLQIGGIETLKGIDEATATEALNRLDFHVKEVLKK